MFNKKVPSEAPIMPVIIVIIAVKDGIPPISSEIPIAMGISELIGGIPSLTAIITIITGIIGASLGTFLLNIFKIKNMSARGFAFGLASHGIGTARAMSKNKTAGVFAALAMGLSGIATSVFVLIIIKFLI